MAITFNEKTVAAEQGEPGIARQRLLTNERVKGTKVLIDRLTLAGGTKMQLNISAKSLAWMQVLGGDATFKANFSDKLSDNNSVFLSPGFNSTLTTDKGVTLLYAEIPDVGAIDPGFPANTPRFMVIDWRREAVFESENDTRKRIPLVTPLICDTAAMKAEMVIHPGGSMAPKYHHVGADTIMYLISGRGMAMVNEQRSPVRAGDLLYFPDREPHYLKGDDASEMRFLELCVPGKFETVWDDKSKKSAWQSTGRDINGNETAEDERERNAFRYMFGSPWIR